MGFKADENETDATKGEWTDHTFTDKAGNFYRLWRWPTGAHKVYRRESLDKMITNQVALKERVSGVYVPCSFPKEWTDLRIEGWITQ